LNVTRHPCLIKYALFYEYANEPHLHSLPQLRDPLVDNHTLIWGVFP